MIKSEGFAAINSKFSSVTMFAGMTCVRRDLPSVSVPVFLPAGGVVLNEKNPGAPFEEAVVTFHRHPVVKDTSYRTRQVSRY